MLIQKCNEDDIVRVGAFYDKVVKWLEEHVNYPEWVYKGYPSEKFARAMTETGDEYICVDDDRIIGVFAVNADPQGDYDKGEWQRDLPEGSYLVIHALAVDPEFMGKGVATEIIRYCVNKAEEEGYKALRVDIVPKNDPAKRLYMKNGFTFAGEADIRPEVKHIPYFSLFELNF